MNKYELCYFNEKGKQIKELLGFKEENFIDCQNSIKNLNKYMLIVEYYDIVKDNLLELMDEINKSELQHQDNFFVTINRRMFNFLDTFYAYISFCEKNYKDIFSKVKTATYDNHFEYRLLYHLRAYMTHCEIAITKVTYDILKNKQTIILDMNEITEKGKKNLKKEFIAEIKKENIKELDLKKIISQFIILFDKIQEAIIELILKDVLSDLEKLKNVIVTNKKGIIMETYLSECGKENNQISSSYIYINFQNKFMKRYEGKIFTSTPRHTNNNQFYE